MKKFFRKVGDGIAIGVILLILFVFITWPTGIIHYGGYLISEEKTVYALRNSGFTDIEIVKRNCSFVQMRGGGKDDDVRFTALATNPAGERVTMYVFVGWPWKGATIRTP